MSASMSGLPKSGHGWAIYGYTPQTGRRSKPTHRLALPGHAGLFPLACRGFRRCINYNDLGRPLRTNGIFDAPHALTLLAPRHEGEPLEQVHVLLVLDQRAVQRRDELLGVALAQRLRADVLDHEQLEPVEQLRGRRLLLHPRHLAYLVEQPQRL